MTDQPDLYKVLQVDSEADPEVIQAAYRRLAQKFHPDLATGVGAAERMVLINSAWEVLGDPVRRAEYDRQLALARARLGPPAAAQTAAQPGTHAAQSTTHSAHSGPDRAAPSVPRSPTHRPTGGAGMPPPEPISSNWTSGRSNVGGGYDERSMRRPDGDGAAGPPPGKPSGSVVNFGRYSGWSLGEIAGRDLEYLEWLDRMTIGRPYRDEIDLILRRAGRRRSAARDDRPGLFRRR
ncbi:MAG: DnaJ domain-containing protein [Candidatus Limnocylindrales bacterium]